MHAERGDLIQICKLNGSEDFDALYIHAFAKPGRVLLCLEVVRVCVAILFNGRPTRLLILKMSRHLPPYMLAF